MLSYSTLRDLFKAKVKKLGYRAERFGLHSLQAGGASAAANSDVPDRLFKRHGRWKSENAKDGYVEYSIETFICDTKLGPVRGKYPSILVIPYSQLLYTNMHYIH